MAVSSDVTLYLDCPDRNRGDAYAPGTSPAVGHSGGAFLRFQVTRVQGYLAHKKRQPPRTLQYDYAYGRTVVLVGLLFLLSEVPLYPRP